MRDIKPLTKMAEIGNRRKEGMVAFIFRSILTNLHQKDFTRLFIFWYLFSLVCSAVLTRQGMRSLTSQTYIADIGNW